MFGISGQKSQSFDQKTVTTDDSFEGQEFSQADVQCSAINNMPT